MYVYGAERHNQRNDELTEKCTFRSSVSPFSYHGTDSGSGAGDAGTINFIPRMILLGGLEETLLIILSLSIAVHAHGVQTQPDSTATKTQEGINHLLTVSINQSKCLSETLSDHCLFLSSFSVLFCISYLGPPISVHNSILRWQFLKSCSKTTRNHLIAQGRDAERHSEWDWKRKSHHLKAYEGGKYRNNSPVNHLKQLFISSPSSISPPLQVNGGHRDTQAVPSRRWHGSDQDGEAVLIGVSLQIHCGLLLYSFWSRYSLRCLHWFQQFVQVYCQTKPCWRVWRFTAVNDTTWQQLRTKLSDHKAVKRFLCRLYVIDRWWCIDLSGRYSQRSASRMVDGRSVCV